MVSPRIVSDMLLLSLQRLKLQDSLLLDCSCLGNPPLIMAPNSEISSFVPDTLSDTTHTECWSPALIEPTLTDSPCPLRAWGWAGRG